MAWDTCGLGYYTSSKTQCYYIETILFQFFSTFIPNDLKQIVVKWCCPSEWNLQILSLFFCSIQYVTFSSFGPVSCLLVFQSSASISARRRSESIFVGGRYCKQNWIHGDPPWTATLWYEHSICVGCSVLSLKEHFYMCQQLV